MFTPSQEILFRYADLMINFALWHGKGIKKGDIVYVGIPECAKPFLIPLHETILKAGAHPIIQYIPNGLNKNFFENATHEQINHYNKEYSEGITKSITHRLRVISEHDKHELDKIPGKKIAQFKMAQKQFKDQISQKELDGKLSRTLCLYGTPAMAQEAGLSLEDYRDQIIKACYLDLENPIQKRQELQKQNQDIQDKLTSLQIQFLQIKGENIDLKIQIGSNRKRLGGRGNNIPSFEVFTSPNRRGTEGKIKFDQPLYLYGQLVKGIYLEFTNGIITKATAESNQELLEEIIKIPNANKLGEFSLTDKKMSRINKFMAETLFDENVGGEFGNMHIAIGSSFKDAYNGDGSKQTESQREDLGFNDSAEHKDIINTQDKTVTAILANGQKKLIYSGGEFLL